LKRFSTNGNLTSGFKTWIDVTIYLLIKENQSNKRIEDKCFRTEEKTLIKKMIRINVQEIIRILDIFYYF